MIIFAVGRGAVRMQAISLSLRAGMITRKLQYWNRNWAFFVAPAAMAPFRHSGHRELSKELAIGVGGIGSDKIRILGQLYFANLKGQCPILPLPLPLQLGFYVCGPGTSCCGRRHSH